MTETPCLRQFSQRSALNASLSSLRVPFGRPPFPASAIYRGRGKTLEVQPSCPSLLIRLRLTLFARLEQIWNIPSSRPAAKDMSKPITRPAIEALRERIRRLEGAAARRRLVLPFGLKAIDRHLPEGGLALGALHEVAGGGHGAINGAAAALFTAGIGARTPG